MIGGGWFGTTPEEAVEDAQGAVSCGFCGRHDLPGVAGIPPAFICFDCVDLANDIRHERLAPKS